MKIIQKSLLLCLCIFAIYAKGNAQNARKYYPAYNLLIDKQWIDSLKKIVKKGPPPYPDYYHMAPYWKKEFHFLESCRALGLYYERLYDKGLQRNMGKALFYYNKIVELDNFPDNDTIVYRASALRTTLYRKLADIYFKGKGVKKDREKSLDFALAGITDAGMFTFYSQRYFHHTKVVFPYYPLQHNQAGPTLLFGYNPFAARVSGMSIRISNADLYAIGNTLIKRNEEKNTTMTIQGYCEASSRGQARAQQICENIKTFFVKKMNIDADKISTNIEVGGEPHNAIEIKFEP